MRTLARISLRHPALVLAALVLVSGLFAAGIARLRTDVGYRAFLGPAHPAVAEFDAFLERFGGGLPLAAVWRCAPPAPCASVFDPSALEMARAVAVEMARSPGVRAAASPATSPLMIPTEGGFAVRRLVTSSGLAADRERLARRALEDPTWVGAIVSDDGRTGAIALDLASSDSEASVAVYRALERALAPWEARGFTFHLVGGPVEFVVAGGDLQRATQRIVPLVVLVVGGLLWALFRSLGAVVAALVSMGAAVLWTMGGLGWLGWPQSSITQVLPPLVLVVGVCDGIHVLSRYAAEMAGSDGRGAAARREALLRVAGDVGPPCVVTSVTTIGAFASFATSGLESFVRFGLISAFGVAAALVLTFTLLPILLVRVPGERMAARGTRAWERGLARLVAASERAAAPIVAVAAALAVAGAVGTASLRVDASFEDLYGERSAVVRWARFVEEHLRRPDTLEIELVLPDGVSAESPEALAELAEASHVLPEAAGLGRARSLLDPLGWVNRLLHGDDPAFERAADTTSANAQLLLLLSLEDPRALDAWVAVDRSRLRLSIESSKAPQERLRAILASVHAALGEILPEGYRTVVTGPLALVHDMIEEIQRTQLRSFATAGAAVLLLVALFFRSLAWAGLAMVPTLLPVVVSLGAMRALGVNLDVGTAMVAAVVVGIAVDDTVHLLSQYRRRLRAGLPPDAAMRGAVPHVGRALVTTSVALTFGFFSLLASPWSSVARFGVVSGVAIVGALVAALVVLPAGTALAARARRSV